jgi:anti-anti-sigma factor
VPPRPTRISTFAPESETDPWFFCLRHPVANGSIRVAMVGELDLATAARAGRAIRRAQGDAAEVICDLADLSFVDVCGLHVLLDASGYARRTGARLIFVGLPASIRRHLAMLGFAGALDTERRSLRSPALRPAGCAAGDRRARRLVSPRRRR